MVMSLVVISVVVAVGCDFLLVVTVVVLLAVIDGDFSGAVIVGYQWWRICGVVVHCTAVC